MILLWLIILILMIKHIKLVIKQQFNQQLINQLLVKRIKLVKHMIKLKVEWNHLKQMVGRVVIRQRFFNLFIIN